MYCSAETVCVRGVYVAAEQEVTASILRVLLPRALVSKRGTGRG